MPNIGFWATAGAGGGGGGAMELITTVYGTGSSSSLELSSIPATYKHLQLRIVGVATSSGYRIQMRMNGVTSNSYTAHYLSANGSSVFMENAGTGTSRPYIDTTQYSQLNNTYPTPAIIDIFDYLSTSKVKTIKSLEGAFTSSGGSAHLSMATGSLLSTSAVSSITLLANSGTWASTARVSLYGVTG